MLSTTINKYIYINVNQKFDNLIRASYSVTEFAKSPDDLKHELIRESLKFMAISGGVEITSISDIPSSGTGLGSSSSYTVGVINALSKYLGQDASKEYLAASASHIEIERCGKPIGKQDQYAAAYGGLNLIEFFVDGSVKVSPVMCKEEIGAQLKENLLLLYTGVTRSADEILVKQNEKIISEQGAIEALKKMAGLAYESGKVLESGDLSRFGEILDENWQLKRKMAPGISDDRIDEWYQIARDNGAIGGKILGAGGGGFMLLYAPAQKHQQIIGSLVDLRPTDFDFETKGSEIIYYN